MEARFESEVGSGWGARTEYSLSVTERAERCESVRAGTRKCKPRPGDRACPGVSPSTGVPSAEVRLGFSGEIVVRRPLLLLLLALAVAAATCAMLTFSSETSRGTDSESGASSRDCSSERSSLSRVGGGTWWWARVCECVTDEKSVRMNLGPLRL